MGKHYKAFGIALLALTLSAALLLILRPYFTITPAIHAEYEKTIKHYAAKNDLDPSLVLAVVKAESNFDPKAISHADAYGLMQITEETLKWAIYREGINAEYTVEDLLKPEINIRYGCLILSLLSEEFEDTATTLAAYNAGRGNVIKWLKDSRYSEDGKTIKTTPFKETNDYIDKVLKYQEKYQQRAGGTE